MLGRSFNHLGEAFNAEVTHIPLLSRRGAARLSGDRLPLGGFARGRPGKEQKSSLDCRVLDPWLAVTSPLSLYREAGAPWLHSDRCKRQISSRSLDEVTVSRLILD